MKILLLSLLFIACSSTTIKNSQLPIQPIINLCKPACEHLSSLIDYDGKDGCLISRTIQYPSGTQIDCETSCNYMIIHTKLYDPKCWTTLNSCDEIQICRKDN